MVCLCLNALSLRPVLYLFFKPFNNVVQGCFSFVSVAVIKHPDKKQPSNRVGLS